MTFSVVCYEYKTVMAIPNRYLTSPQFTATYGEKKRLVLSPMLFAIYKDKLLIRRLKNTEVVSLERLPMLIIVL